MTTLYLDSSALVKLVAPEPQTAALLELIEPRPEVVSSALAQVEVLRAVRRSAAPRGTRDRALAVLSRVHLIAMDGPILEAAAALEPPDLRSLDAIHLATALALGPELDALVGYDSRLNAAAEAAGLRVLGPA